MSRARSRLAPIHRYQPMEKKSVYPSVLPSALGGSLASTGAPIATLLLLATVLISLGLFMVRASRLASVAD